VTRALAADGIAEPNAIQQACFAPILSGRHVVIESATGTGKTLAYLLPILQRLRNAAEGRVVCFAPATELAVQIVRVVERYKEPALKVAGLVASSNSRQQQAKVQQSTRLIVGTPGRILELYAQRKLKGVGTVVLDEPEPILASRDAEYLREVLSRPDPKIQLVLAAATFGVNSRRWISERLGPDVVHCRTSEDPLRERIRHGSLWVHDETNKDRTLARFIQKMRCERAIVFVNQPNLQRHLYRFLNEQGLRTVTVSRERSKLECQQAIAEFGRSNARVLLTTDQAATGLDVPAVGWVLHYDLPVSASAYVHRAGRTGRANEAGSSVALVSQADLQKLERLARELGIEFVQLAPV
jgi:ATP-dependent RNA helicase DeaD